MTYKIDAYDRKILYELDKNSAASLPDLANKLKKSKQFILYRMKKLEEANIITTKFINIRIQEYLKSKEYIENNQHLFK